MRQETREHWFKSGDLNQRSKSAKTWPSGAHPSSNKNFRI